MKKKHFTEQQFVDFPIKRNFCYPEPPMWQGTNSHNDLTTLYFILFSLVVAASWFFFAWKLFFPIALSDPVVP